MNDYFSIRLSEDPRRRSVWQEITSYLAPWIRVSDRVAELGAGYADWIQSVRAHTRLAIDQDKGILARALDGVDVRCMSVTDASLRNVLAGSTVVCASNLLEHLSYEEGAQVVRVVFEALPRDGRLILIQPNFRFAYRRYFDDYTHRSIYTDEGLSGLLKSVGFRLARVEARFLPFSMRQTPSWLPLRHLVRWYLRSPIRPRAGQMLLIAEKP